MKEYFLFLDESKPNTNFQNFTLGGIAIEKETYELKLKPLVNGLKKKKGILMEFPKSNKKIFLKN